MTTNNQPTHPRRLSKKYLSSEAGQQLIRDIVDCSHTMIDDDLAEMLGIKSHQLTYLRMKLGIKSGGKLCKKQQLTLPPAKTVESYDTGSISQRRAESYRATPVNPVQTYNRLVVTLRSGEVYLIPSNQLGMDYIVDNFDSITELTKATYDDAKWRGDQ